MEGFWKRKQIQKVEIDEVAKKQVEQALQQADHTTFSTLSPNYPLEKVGEEMGAGPRSRPHARLQDASRDEFIDITDKRTISRKEVAPGEMIVARILKGILNVSDVVRIDKKRLILPDKKFFLSKVMPLDKIEKETSEAEIRADIQVLKTVFYDSDHLLGDNKSAFPSDRDFNIARDNNRAVYYDFAHYDDTQSQNELHGKMKYVRELHYLTDEEISIYRNKIAMLKERISGEDGLRFLEAVAASAGNALQKLFLLDRPKSKRTPAALQELLLGRMDHALRYLEEVKIYNRKPSS